MAAWLRTLTCLACLALVACGPPRGPQAAAASVPLAPATVAAAVIAAPSEPSAPSEPPAPAARDASALRSTIEGGGVADERRAAIDQAGDDAAPLLRALGSDPDPIVRRWAALALERIARPALSASLAQVASGERDPAVRHILERALRRAQ
ncbi:MAG: HEAT repeat domain-containing protein [Planctomycetota bacterium]